jgi:hypothetical protein
VNPVNDNSIRFRVEPRLVPPVKAARLLHLTLPEFEAKRTALHGAGMPSPCPVTGHFDLKALGAWLDRSAGLAVASGPVTAAMDASVGFAERLARLG